MIADPVGLSLTQQPRTRSLCDETIQAGDGLTVNDMLSDVHFRHTLCGTGEPHILFYAGAPLIMPAGHRLGTVCVMDQEPRTCAPEHAPGLLSLAENTVNFHIKNVVDKLGAEDRTHAVTIAIRRGL